MAGHDIPDCRRRYELNLRSAAGTAFERMRGAIGGWSGGSTALRLMASAHEDSTAAAYSRHWASFCDWCADNELEPFPATPPMVAAYIGSLAERGTVAEASLQPYLSAINSFHADAGAERPAVGHLIVRARQGMARGQAALLTRDTRVPLPAGAALGALDAALAALPAMRRRLAPRAMAEWLRARYELVLAFVFFARQDSCVSLAARDHDIDGEFLWLRITEKMKRGWAFRRVIRIPLDSEPSNGVASAIPRLAELGKAYMCAREALVSASQIDPPYFFQLPGEPKPASRHMATRVAHTLAAHGVRAPEGFAYLGHSLRSGGSSAAEAIGVSRYLGNWLGGLGGWSQTGRTRELHYLDPSIGPTPDAYALLGWLLRRVFTAEATECVRSTACPSDEPGEASEH